MSYFFGVAIVFLLIFIFTAQDLRRLDKKIATLPDEEPETPMTEYENLYTTQEPYNRYDGIDY